MNVNSADNKIQFFSASEKDSFAAHTVRTRFPEKFTQCGLTDYENFIGTTSVREGLGDKPKTPENHPGWQAIFDATKSWHSKTIKEFFETAPFLLAEFYFYHLLLVRKGYEINNSDFFSNEKDFELNRENRKGKLSKELEKLFTQKFTDEKVLFKSVLNYSLTANTADLSQLTGTERNSVQIIHDDSEQCYAYLSSRKKAKQMDIICDNSGKELFSDLYLAVFLVLYNYTEKVVMHVKPCPFFVSDATAVDFGKLVKQIIDENGSEEKNHRLLSMLNDDSITVQTHDFWVEAKYFDEMPSKLKRHFKRSSLVIVKGDLNYRRLVQDKNWSYKDSFRKRCLIKNVPVLAPRVLKSDVVVGVSDSMNAFAEAEDAQYQRNGKFGVIQFRGKKMRYEVKHKKGNICNDKRKKKMEQDKKNWQVNLFHGVLISIIVLIIVTLLIVAKSHLGNANLAGNNGNKDIDIIQSEKNSYNDVNFSLMLTGLVIFVSASVLLPDFIMEKKIKDEVEKFGTRTIENKTRECIASEVYTVHNEIFRTDAHLSRMVAFEISGKYPIWSIGWAFRSLKRYRKLNSEQIGFEEYVDFIDFLRKRVCVVAVKKVEDKSFSKNGISIEKLWAYIINEQSFENGEYKIEGIRAAIRAIKDIIDLEYSIFEDSFFEIDDFAKTELKKISFISGNFCRLICAALIEKYPNEKNGNLVTDDDKDGCSLLLKEILKISDYGIKGKLAKNEEVKTEFKQRLMTEFIAIRSQKKLLLSDKLLEEDDRRFFRPKERLTLES